EEDPRLLDPHQRLGGDLVWVEELVTFLTQQVLTRLGDLQLAAARLAAEGPGHPPLQVHAHLFDPLVAEELEGRPAAGLDLDLDDPVLHEARAEVPPQLVLRARVRLGRRVRRRFSAFGAGEVLRPETARTLGRLRTRRLEPRRARGRR